MFTVDQFHELRNDIIQDEYYELVPNICPFCKFPIIINYERTIMKCSNKYCPEHLSHKADAMFKEMGIKYIGAKTAYHFITKNKLKNHMDILSLTEDQLPDSHSPEVKRRMWNSLQSGRKQTLSKILQMYQLDGIAEQTSSKILENYNSFEDFFNEHQNAVDIIKHIGRSLKQYQITPHLVKMGYHLYKAKEDLIRIEKYFEIVKLSSEKLRICMTGEISSVYMEGKYFKPREEFLKVLNEKYEGIISFVSSGRNVSDAHYLLTDSSRRTGKMKDALHFKVPIVSFAQFCDFIEYTYGQGKEDIVIKRRT